MRAKLILSGMIGCVVGLIAGSLAPTIERIEVSNKLVACEHRATVAEVLNEEWCGEAPLKKISCEKYDMACMCQTIPRSTDSDLLEE